MLVKCIILVICYWYNYQYTMAMNIKNSAKENERYDKSVEIEKAAH